MRRLLKFTWLGRCLLIPFRLGFALTFWLRDLAVMVRWALTSKEHYNHTYHLTPLNRQYLASYVAVISGHSQEEMAGYMEELEQDQELHALLERQTLSSPDRHNSDVEPRYGRRLGWYALVRATKPKVVMETGVDRGLGTAVLAAAVRRNFEEGYAGLVYATDINPQCGHLLAAPYSDHARILLGDSVELLKSFPEPVDIFIHDSDHRPEYEWSEFLAVEPHLHPTSLVMSDNSQQTSKMLEFAGRMGRSFLYFQDEPERHWWPGDGIGAAFVAGEKICYQAGADLAASQGGRET